MENLEFYREYSDMGLEKLEVVAKTISQVSEGRFLEIGTNAGGTAMMAIDSQQSTSVISVDPYGGVPFLGIDGRISEYKFLDMLGVTAMAELYKRAKEKNKIFTHFKTTSNSFLSSNLDFWENGEKLFTKDLKYSFVLLDGEHTTSNVITEISYLQNRMNDGGIILIDNIDWLDRTFLPENMENVRFDMAIIKF